MSDELTALVDALCRLADKPGVRVKVSVEIGGAAPPAGAWGSGPGPKHDDGFRRVYWPDLGTFTFGPKQALVVAELWDARFNADAPDVAEGRLLLAADSDCSRLLDLFRSSGRTHPAWGTLVLRGDGPATYRLPDPPGAG